MVCIIQAFLALFLWQANSVAVTDPPGIHIMPYLQNVTPTGITVMWETTHPVVGSVAFGQHGVFDRTAIEPAAVKIHEVRLTDLKAGMVPGIKVDTEYIPTGPNRFFSVVSSKVETVNEEGKKETTVETTIDTYEVIFDLATGKETEIIWLFRDVVNVRSSREVRIAADGTETFANEIWIEVQRIKNIG